MSIVGAEQAVEIETRLLGPVGQLIGNMIVDTYECEWHYVRSVHYACMIDTGNGMSQAHYRHRTVGYEVSETTCKAVQSNIEIMPHVYWAVSNEYKMAYMGAQRAKRSEYDIAYVTVLGWNARVRRMFKNGNGTEWRYDVEIESQEDPKAHVTWVCSVLRM